MLGAQNQGRTACTPRGTEHLQGKQCNQANKQAQKLTNKLAKVTREARIQRLLVASLQKDEHVGVKE